MSEGSNAKPEEPDEPDEQEGRGDGAGSESAPQTGRVLSAEWLASAADRSGWPTGGLPEVAFLGRSNVGKSSLLNKLVNRRGLARTSSTPGKTRLLHFFTVKRTTRDVVFVDLPGYGYAKVAMAERKRWRGMIESYLGAREELRAAVLLQDVRRDFSEDEELLVAWLAERSIPVLVALTKVDKLNQKQRAARLRALRGALPVQADWWIETSATKGRGLDLLWRRLEPLL
ncbi:MAG: ribosome biogenesis GTP-binding protein YihA/YsxC [Myxococcota bacterium]|nr:ribosome biogenesis GTP-binding protein YihA/YsxC [Myxococcota bacterium]